MSEASARTGSKPRVGVFGIGLQAYWAQFSDLRERLEEYQREVEAGLAGAGAEVVSAGLVDTPAAGRAAGELLARADLDLAVCYVGTYSTASQVVPVVQHLNRPVLVLNLQPTPALDYERTDTAEWLANCCVCCVPELANAFHRAGIAFHLVTGLLRREDGVAGARAWEEIEGWVAAAGVARTLRTGRLGILGHTYPGMLDLYSDLTAITAQTGLHIELLEMEELEARVNAADSAAIDRQVAQARERFELSEDSPSDPLARAPRPDDLTWVARVAVGLDGLQRDFALDALAYYYRGLDRNINERLMAGAILGLTQLTGRGVPCAGEGDAKTAIAMLVMDRLGAGGSFTEFCAMDFVDDFFLMGHDGPVHPGITDRKPLLRGLEAFHGKSGRGIAVEGRVRTGPVTILTVTQTVEGRLKLLTAEGQALPGPTLRVGNTTSRIAFTLPPAEFLDRWCAHAPTHHCALGTGQVAERIAKVGRLLRLEVVHVS